MCSAALGGLAAVPARPLLLATLLLYSQEACGGDTLTPSGPAASLELSKPTISLSAGDSLVLTATARGSTGSVLSGKTINWQTSNPNIATVTPTGIVRGVTAGTASITASVDTVKATAQISVAAAVVAAPELPRVYLNTTMPAVTGKTITVPAGGDLQAALDQAQPGDEVVLQAGATYTGWFILRVKSGAGTVPGTGPVITVRSSALASLPAGRRVSPSDAQYMAKLVTPGGGEPPISTDPGAAGWRLSGLELTAADTVTVLGRIVRFGDGNPTQNTASQVPMNLVLDRSYVHGTPKLDLRRCVDMQSGATAIIDSYLSACHSVGSDAQAIASWNGPGPYKIVNNYLEGSGENVMFGGADVNVPNQLPSDIEVRGNYFYKPLTWKQNDPSYAGTPWGIKNLFELKMGHRILVEGNVFEQVWVDAQVGFALLLKTSNDQAFPTTDVTVRNNIVRGAAGAVNIAGIEAPIYRVSVTDNLFLDIGSPQWDPTNQNGRLFQWFNAQDVTFAHNVGFAPQMFVSLDVPTSPRLIFRDNIVGHGAYGLKGSGTGEGTPTLDALAPGWNFAGNMVVGFTGSPAIYPDGNYFPATLADVGFTNPVNGDYSLATGTTYKGKATDGTDPGIDPTALSTATANVKP